MLRFVLVLVLGFISLGAFKAPLERMALYPFDSTHVSPQSLGQGRLSEQEWIAPDGSKLIVWTALPNKGKPVIFYLHGNAGNLANRAGRFVRFLDRGYGLIAPAYRGSSGSDGSPSQKVISADIRHIWRNKQDILPTGDAPIVLYGESLGTGVAITGLLASTATDAEKGAGRPAAVVLEAPFTSIPDVVQGLYPSFSYLADYVTETWDSLRYSNWLIEPLLIIHGTKDELIPIEQGRRIFSAAPTQEKQFITVNGAGHTDLWRSDVLPRLWRFIDAYAVNIP